MPRFINPPTAPQPQSRYSQAVLVTAAYKRAIVSGQIGANRDGVLAEGLEGQIAQAFDNFLAVLEAADLGIDDVIKITAYSAVKGSVGLFRAVREAKFGKAVPAATYIEVAGFASPLHLFEIEGEALREAPFATAPEPTVLTARRKL